MNRKRKSRDDEMKERLALGLLVIAGFIGTLFAAPVLATVAESFLVIEGARVTVEDDDDELEARLITEGLLIPTDGSEGAFGYGILTEDGDAILVATTHAGVVDITWQSPGEVEINDNTASISGVPTDEFEGWDSITGEELSMTLGQDVSNVVSFKLDPVFDEEDGLQAVCVTDIKPAENIDVRQ